MGDRVKNKTAPDARATTCSLSTLTFKYLHKLKLMAAPSRNAGGLYGGIQFSGSNTFSSSISAPPLLYTSNQAAPPTPAPVPAEASLRAQAPAPETTLLPATAAPKARLTSITASIAKTTSVPAPASTPAVVPATIPTPTPVPAPVSPPAPAPLSGPSTSGPSSPDPPSTHELNPTRTTSKTSTALRPALRSRAAIFRARTRASPTRSTAAPCPVLQR